MRVGLFQMDAVEGERQRNLDVVADAASRAQIEGAEILALPELWCAGYDLSRSTEGEWGDAEIDFLADLSRQHDLAILGGSLLVRGAARYSNVAVAFENGEVRSRYAKLHLFAPLDEDLYLEAGSEIPRVFSLAGVRCATTICYDLRFPEVYRPPTVEGVDLLYVPAQWPRPRIHHWDALVTARAIEAQAFVLAVNRRGQFQRTEFAGHSRLVGPGGDVIVDAGEEPGLYFGEMDLTQVKESREKLPIIGDRRADLFPFLRGDG